MLIDKTLIKSFLLTTSFALIIAAVALPYLAINLLSISIALLIISITIPEHVKYAKVKNNQNFSRGSACIWRLNDEA